MNTTQLHEERIFLDALELAEPAARRALVKARCEGNEPLRQRVLGLLSVSDSEGILDESAARLAGLEVDESQMPKVGTVLGHYELVEQIGVGGMGVVFRARQHEPVTRDVAIKVIKLGMDTQSVMARFEAERQTLAKMDHPFVTRVFDAGSTEFGRPYFVMELVRGTAIHAFCDQRGLEIDDRLQLFVKTCQAIQHAHSQGIVHRDIKPGNILVAEHDGERVPKIIDFGIAKATDRELAGKTMFTHLGQMIGTPMYMSPEQSEIGNTHVDARSDIYSLGVVLYELLTGETPFNELKESGFQRVRNAIQAVDPPLASQRVARRDSRETAVSRRRGTDNRSLTRRLSGDLDWILRRCLAKSPDERYLTAGDLARDVQRYLAGEPVEAAAPTANYRLRKYVERHRNSVLAGAVIVIVLCAGGLMAALYGVAAQQLAERTERAELITNAALVRAGEEHDRALRAERQLVALERQRMQDLAFYFKQLNGDWDQESPAEGKRKDRLEKQAGKPQLAQLDPPRLATPLDAGSLAARTTKKTTPCESSQMAARRRVPADDWLEWEQELASQLGGDRRLQGEVFKRFGDYFAAQKLWSDAEIFYRKAHCEWNHHFDFDDPDLFRVRLLVSKSLLEQHQLDRASKAIESIASDVECMVEELPQDVTELLGQLKSRTKRLLGRDI